MTSIMVIYDKSEEKIIYFALQHLETRKFRACSHQLLRAFDHIYMEKVRYKFLIIITSTLSLK